jgi:hypothetical protein
MQRPEIYVVSRRWRGSPAYWLTVVLLEQPPSNTATEPTTSIHFDMARPMRHARVSPTYDQTGQLSLMTG